MMKLYFIIIHFGVIGGTVGPLPYSKAECDMRAAEIQAEINSFIGKVVNGHLMKPGDVRVFCEFHASRPINGEPRP